MKNNKANLFAMAAIQIAAILAACIGVYYILCAYTHVAFSFANIEMWIGCTTIAVVSVVIAHLYKEIRKQERIAVAAQ